MSHVLASMSGTDTVVIKGQPKKGQEISNLVHPSYDNWSQDWIKYRTIWEGGRQFIDAYLQQYSNREDATDFAIRKKLTYSPGHARTAVLETKNSIYERFIDISRTGGSSKYQDWIAGRSGGIDGTGIDMNKFIGTVCLPELLVTRRVGVYVDAPAVETITKRDEQGFMPYAYVYKAEDIRTWSRKGDTSDELTAVLLRDTVYTYDAEFGLIDGTSSQFRLLTKVFDEESGKPQVLIRFYTAKDKELEDDRVILDLPEIPFDFVELDHSILSDVADHQIALLNLSSSDLNYCMKSNFPFYTEEFDPKTELPFATGGDEWSDNTQGTASNAQEADAKTANVGVMNGRRYPKGTTRPGFIHPSAEPLKASMAKQEEIRTEIRQLVLLSVSSLNPDVASSERDDQGLEAGLSFIGMTLQELERRIARIFALYENQNAPELPTINYPTDYRIRSEKDRREEADQLLEIMPKIASITYQKETSKRVVDLTMSHWMDNQTSKKIKTEIDDAKVIVTDPDVLLADHEKGLVSDETASAARLYPKGEVEKAKVDHALRIARIQAAQSAEKVPTDAGARGVDDLSVDNNEAAQEKKDSQDPNLNGEAKTKTRGKAK